MAPRRLRLILLVVFTWTLVAYYYSGSSVKVPARLPVVSDEEPLDTEKQQNLRWKPMVPLYPPGSPIDLPKSSTAVKIPRIQAKRPTEDPAAKAIRLQRLGAVKDSFVHSWQGYKKHAWLQDEVAPLTGKTKNLFGGWAATLVDSLDSLWILDMKDDFVEAVRACDKIDFSKTETTLIQVFETTIRYLGGFLAAYELSGKEHKILLKKAVEVGNLLLGAFDTPNRMPVARWKWRDYIRGHHQTAAASTLVSELGSLCMELSKLSQLTGNLIYHDAGQKISDEMEKAQGKTALPGMWPIVVDASITPLHFTGDTYTIGGMADSLYEYLPKQYLVLGGRLPQPRKMYEAFIEVAKKHLFHRALNPENLKIMFSGDWRFTIGTAGEAIPKGQHLSCFAGGMVGLAAKIFDRPADLEIAIQLTDGCVWSYNSTLSRIGPEIFHFIPCDPDSDKDGCEWSDKRWIEALRRHWRPGSDAPDADIRSIADERRLPLGIVDVDDRKYILRPEAIESVFLMYRMTGDAAWMDKAWAMFQAIEKHCRTDIAAAALEDITLEKPEKVDSMESFWLAETLKYFYLIYSEWDVVSLDEWVLNTEAHPLRRGDAPR